MNDLFHKIANKVSSVTGTPAAFLFALVIVIVWAVTGPMFNFSPTWQLVINTGTTIVTFLMVFLVQNTQNRDAKAMQLKLDELIRSTKGARNDFVGLEELSDDELKALDADFRMLYNSKDTALMRKLQKTIESESNRRKARSLKQHALNAAGAVVNLLDPRSNDKK